MADILAEFERLASGADTAKLDGLLAPELSQPWLPNPGPQTDAYLSKADLLLYGGAAGGGKTDLLLGTALTTQNRSVIFRRAYVDLRGVEERLIELRRTRDGYNGADMVLRDGGRVLEFGALEKPGAEFSWQGRPHDFIGFDEGAQLSAAKVSFVLGWLRTTDSDQRCRAVIASNPPMGGEGDWLVEWFAPWLDPMYPNPAKPGELRWAVTLGAETKWVDGPEPVEIAGEVYTPLSRSFIPALLDDNPYLRETGYRARIQNMPEPLRSQLLKGDFLAGKEDHPFQVIPSEWVDLAQERWKKGKASGSRMDTVGVDVAQGGPDNTVLAPLYGVWFDNLQRHKGIDTKDGPTVAGLVMKAVRNGALVCIDLTGGWGISARDHLASMKVRCRSVVFSSSSGRRSKQGDYLFANKRADMFWSFREALDPSAHSDDEMPALPPDRQLSAQLCAPQWKLKGDKLYIESKEEIATRLGSSTDDADAVIMAWDGREEAAANRVQRRPSQKSSDPLSMYRPGGRGASDPLGAFRR